MNNNEGNVDCNIYFRTWTEFPPGRPKFSPGGNFPPVGNHCNSPILELWLDWCPAWGLMKRRSVPLCGPMRLGKQCGLSYSWLLLNFQLQWEMFSSYTYSYRYFYFPVTLSSYSLVDRGQSPNVIDTSINIQQSDALTQFWALNSLRTSSHNREQAQAGNNS